MPAVLLLMDLQPSVLRRLPDDRVLERAVAAADAAREASVPVVFVRVAFRDGAPEVAARNRQFAALRDGAMMPGESDPRTQVHEALQRRPDEPVVVKRRVSAFSGSDLAVLLSGLGAVDLVLGGVSTSGVVLSTVRQAADLDFGLTVLEDACADPDEEVHRVLTTTVFPRQAQVETVDGWAAAL